MANVKQIWRRLLSYLRRDQFDRDLEEEMRFHQMMRAEENRGEGMPAEEARFAAQRQFGRSSSQEGEEGQTVSSGLYLYQLRAGNFVQMRRKALVR